MHKNADFSFFFVMRVSWWSIGPQYKTIQYALCSWRWAKPTQYPSLKTKRKRDYLTQVSTLYNYFHIVQIFTLLIWNLFYFHRTKTLNLKQLGLSIRFKVEIWISMLIECLAIEGAQHILTWYLDPHNIYYCMIETFK